MGGFFHAVTSPHTPFLERTALRMSCPVLSTMVSHTVLSQKMYNLVLQLEILDNYEIASVAHALHTCAIDGRKDTSSALSNSCYGMFGMLIDKNQPSPATCAIWWPVGDDIQAQGM